MPARLAIYAYTEKQLIFLLTALKGDRERIGTGSIWTTCWLQDNIHTMRLKALAEKFFHKACYMGRENNLWEHEQLALCKKEIMHLTWSLYLTSIKDYPHEWNSTWKLTRDLNCIMQVKERSRSWFRALCVGLGRHPHHGAWPFPHAPLSGKLSLQHLLCSWKKNHEIKNPKVTANTRLAPSILKNNFWVIFYGQNPPKDSLQKECQCCSKTCTGIASLPCDHSSEPTHRAGQDWKLDSEPPGSKPWNNSISKRSN